MIARLFFGRLSQLLRRFPVVSILGPRQCGKTTFIRSALPDWRYLDVEKPSDAAFLSSDPERALAQLKTHFILDEIQELPALFPVLRGHVDAQRRKRGQM